MRLVAGSADLPEIVEAAAWAGGASAGYAVMFGDRVSVALGLGGQFHAAQFAGGSGAPSFATAYPTLDANLGYVF